MGGLGDKSHRSSSPLKRPASELEEDSTIIANGDVDMVNGPDTSVNGAGSSSKRSNNSPPPASIANMGMKNNVNTKTADDMDTDGEDEEFFAAAAPASALPEDSNTHVAAQNIDSKKVDAPKTVDTPDVDAPSPPPSIDEQIRIVTALATEFNALELSEGTRTYIISNKWVDRVKAHGTGAKVSAEVAESDIGPVDNSDIIWEILKDQNQHPFARLNPDIDGTPGGNITYLPQKAWDLVVSWYGLTDGQPPIVRTAVDTSESSEVNIQFETHPVVYRIHRLWAATSPIPIDQLTKAQKPGPRVWIVSRNEKMQLFLQRIKKATGVKHDCKVKLWTVPESLNVTKDAGSATPSRTSTPAPDAIDWSQMLIEANSFNTLKQGEHKEAVDYKDPTGDSNFTGGTKRTIAMTGLGMDTRIILDELVEGHIYLSTYVKKLKSGGKNSALATTVKGASSALVTTTDSGRSSPAPPPVIRTTRGRAPGKTVGCVGLTNLGNTCYMNSALQCIRSVEELTKYFLSGEADNELNTENPLGKGGQIAMVYNSLLRDLYKTPVPPSVSPRQFKGTIGRFFPNFSGYGQQDSQEFLGLLLDALQEDLNRIKKKPYIEKPDSTDDMVNDPEALKKMADEVWSITKRRDDSVISDLFTGMYKSTLVCPNCAKVSITFDPFNTVTVQIPIESTWSHTIQYFPLNGKPYLIDIDMDKNGNVRMMKEFISSRTKTPVERLFVAEEWKSHFYKYLEDNMQVAEEILQNDIIMVFELDMPPTNWPPVKKQKQKVRSMLYLDDVPEDEVPEWDSPAAERIVVPVVFRRRAKPGKYSSSKKWEATMAPQMICLTKEEARSEVAIRRKILQRVQNQTTYTFLDKEALENPNGEEDLEKDVVVTTASDASSGDGKIAVSSVDGEDDVVDVTMKDTTTSTSSEAASRFEQMNYPGQTSPPRWLDVSVPLPDAFDTIFDICYYRDNKGDHILPQGSSSISDDVTYPSILTRVRRREEIVEEQIAEQEATPVSSVSEEEDDVAQLGESVTRMNEESSEEDDDLSRPQQVLPVRTVNRKSHNVGHSFRNRTARKGLKTYSRKKAVHKSPYFAGLDGSADAPYSYEGEQEQEQDQEPLVRLGEGLVVDWEDIAIACLMDGNEGQGTASYDPKMCPTLPDPVLDEKRQRRSTRRRNGVSLSECLDEFGKEEVLSEMDTWYCPRCKEHRRASKKLELWKTPDILILHFKRFSSTSHRRDKLDVCVDFPIEGLDMTKRIVESDGKEEVYDLFAVDNHYGSLGGGHYTACAKSFVDGEWYDYNDSSVTKMKDPSKTISSAAYLLFYRRRSQGALGGPRFQDIIEKMRANEEADDGDEDEDDEQGNGQRLGVDSPSQNGSSSAYRGVGATVPIQGMGLVGSSGQRVGMLSPVSSPAPLGSRSLGGRVLGMGAANPTAWRSNAPAGLNLHNNKISAAHIENLPDYQDALNEGAEVAQPDLADVAFNDGIEYQDQDADGEYDEGIEMEGSFDATFSLHGNVVPGGYSSAPEPWSFAALESGESGTPNSAVQSDIVDDGSNASDGSRQARLEEFDNAELEEGYREPTPVPELDGEGEAGCVGYGDLHEDLRALRRGRGVPGGIGAYADDGEGDAEGLELEVELPVEGEDETEAMEIHVEEGEGLGKL